MCKDVRFESEPYNRTKDRPGQFCTTSRRRTTVLAIESIDTVVRWQRGDASEVRIQWKPAVQTQAVACRSVLRRRHRFSRVSLLLVRPPHSFSVQFTSVGPSVRHKCGMPPTVTSFLCFYQLFSDAVVYGQWRRKNVQRTNRKNCSSECGAPKYVGGALFTHKSGRGLVTIVAENITVE